MQKHSQNECHHFFRVTKRDTFCMMKKKEKKCLIEIWLLYSIESDSIWIWRWNFFYKRILCSILKSIFELIFVMSMQSILKSILIKKAKKPILSIKHSFYSFLTSSWNDDLRPRVDLLSLELFTVLFLFIF